MGSGAGEGVWRLDSNARSIRQVRVMIVLKQASDGAGAAAVRRSKANALKGRSESDGSISGRVQANAMQQQTQSAKSGAAMASSGLI